MTRDFSAIRSLPRVPAIYALYAGRRRPHVAYVGVAGHLRQRVEQHFLRRDSSVTTGASAVSLDPDQVSELAWWEHERFRERHVLEAAELVAFDIFEPTLRSRGNILAPSEALYREEAFRARMAEYLSAGPTGRVPFPSLGDALARIAELEARLRELEEKLANP